MDEKFEDRDALASAIKELPPRELLEYTRLQKLIDGWDVSERGFIIRVSEFFFTIETDDELRSYLHRIVLRALYEDGDEED